MKKKKKCSSEVLYFSLSSDFKVSQKTLTISIGKCMKNVTAENKIVIQNCNSDESNTLSSFHISMYFSSTIIHLLIEIVPQALIQSLPNLKKKKKYLQKFNSNFVLCFSMSLTWCHWLLKVEAHENYLVIACCSDQQVAHKTLSWDFVYLFGSQFQGSIART